MVLDWKKFVTEKRKENLPLFDRMDNDLDLAAASHFTVKDAHGWRIRGVYNVTLPDPKLFAHRAVTRLASVERQTVIESENLDDEKATAIEHFLDDMAYEADARRLARGEPDVFTSHCQTVCLRGPVAEQVLIQSRGDGRLIPDIRPLDTRNFIYDAAPEGITRAAVVTRRPASAIAREYPDIAVKGSTAEIWDCWDAEKESVFIDERLIMENPNPYGEVPFVVQWPAAGISLSDPDWRRSDGESIFFLCRSDDGTNIWDELNYVASILKTQAAETVQPPQQLPAPPERQIPGNAGPLPHGGRGATGERAHAACPQAGRA